MRLCAQALLAAILFTNVVAADTAATKATLSRSEAADLLSAGRYAELDRLMQQTQDRYREGAISDEQLLAAFRVFYIRDPKQTPYFDAWVKQRPNSYVAHLARGIHLKYVGIEARGGKYISETSREQLDGMRRALEPAIADLRASMALDARPLLSIHHLLEVGKMLGMREMNRDLLRRAEEIDPKNFVVRYRFLLTLQSRWGGSVEEMQDFVDECKRVGLPADKLRAMQREVMADQAWVYYEREQNYEAAARTYDRLLEEGPLSIVDLRQLTWARVKLRQPDAAIVAATRVLEKDPKDVWTLTQRAWCYTQQKKAADAIRDYLAAAELGYAPAQLSLGRVYWHGNFGPPDREAGIKWLRAAAEQGNEAARKDLAWALKLSQPPVEANR